MTKINYGDANNDDGGDGHTKTARATHSPSEQYLPPQPVGQVQTKVPKVSLQEPPF